MMEVPLSTKPEVRVGTPRRLFTFEQPLALGINRPDYALGASGGTFIMIRPLERPPGIVVVQNWLGLAEP